MNKKSTLHETPPLPSTELLAIGVWLLVLICLVSQAVAAPAPKGYLARSKPRFLLEEGAEAKRPVKPLPPLPVVYNPQPRLSGQTALPATQTAARPEFRVESNTMFFQPGNALGGINSAMPIAPSPMVPQQNMFNPQSILRYYTVPAGAGNATIVIDGPSLFQPAPIIPGSKAVYERR